MIIFSGEYCKSRKLLLNRYLNTDFKYDLISFIPFEMLFSGFSTNNLAINLFQLLKFFKYYKLKGKVNYILLNISKSFSYIYTLFLILVFIYLNHYVACVMYLISSYEYKYGDTHNNIVLNFFKKLIINFLL